MSQSTSRSTFAPPPGASAVLGQPVVPRPVFMAPSDGARLIYLLMKQARPGLETVQLVAAHEGEGTTSMVRDLALIAASLGVRVLVLDLDGSGQDHAAWLRTHAGTGPDAALRRWTPLEAGQGPRPAADPSDPLILQLGASSLCVSYRADSAVVTPARYVNTLARLRGEFELILVDVPAFSRSADALLLAPHAFATLLVVAAERTRAQVVDDLRTQILECGGVVTGVVLNRRRMHIPKAIYDRL